MYEKLRTNKDGVPKDFRKSFEKALAEAWKDYNNSGAWLVDAFEDNEMELAFAKGFLEGCINTEKKVIDKVCKFTKANVREYHKSGVFHVGEFITDLKSKIL